MGNNEKIDWVGVPDASVREMLRQAEMCLASTVQLALASDQRATTIAGIFGGAAVALLAAAATILAGSTPDHSLLAGAVGIATPLLLASYLAARAGQPTDFYIPGYEPSKLRPSATDEMWMLRYTINDVQMRIGKNRDVLSHSSRLISCSFITAALAIFIGVSAFLYARSPIGSTPFLKGVLGCGSGGGGGGEGFGCWSDIFSPPRLSGLFNFIPNGGGPKAGEAMDWKVIVAIYAAIVGTGALALEVRRWFETGPRLKIRLIPDGLTIGGNSETDEKDLVIATVINRGTANTMITGMTLHEMSFWERIRRRPSLNLVVTNPQLKGYPPNVPSILEPAKSWVGAIRKSHELLSNIETGKFYVGISASHRDKSYLVRIPKRDTASAKV